MASSEDNNAYLASHRLSSVAFLPPRPLPVRRDGFKNETYPPRTCALATSHPITAPCGTDPTSSGTFLHVLATPLAFLSRLSLSGRDDDVWAFYTCLIPRSSSWRPRGHPHASPTALPSAAPRPPDGFYSLRGRLQLGAL